MPARSELLQAGLRVGPPDSDAGATRSRLHDGRVVSWSPPEGWPAGARVVIDAECRRPPPPALARWLGSEDFWERWTALECRAKLDDVPVHSLLVVTRRLATGELPGVDPRVLLAPRLPDHPDLVVSFGVA